MKHLLMLTIPVQRNKMLPVRLYEASTALRQICSHQTSEHHLEWETIPFQNKLART